MEFASDNDPRFGSKAVLPVSMGDAMLVPILDSLGIPAEGAGLLLAADFLPDIFKTVTHVTADIAAAAIASRWMPGGQRRVIAGESFAAKWKTPQRYDSAVPRQSGGGTPALRTPPQ